MVMMLISSIKKKKSRHTEQTQERSHVQTAITVTQETNGQEQDWSWPGHVEEAEPCPT